MVSVGYKIGGLFIVLFFLMGCTKTHHSSKRGDGTTVKITINKSSFGDYPAVILDLANKRLIKLNQDYNQLPHIAGDLWIEPGDPEIGGLGKEVDGVKHIGDNVVLKVIDENLSRTEMHQLPTRLFKNYIERDQIKSGVVFLVKASDQALYRVKIVELNTTQQIMKLEYSVM